ncbi:MAG TPA: SRPBCC domain-containing protein [Candidatus Limnocylindria bacterium]|nr:SRPBCC domain-containing protein [Candidatus Limnocylindria bacterium]
MNDRVELQTEVDAPRVAVYSLLATSEGLSRWLDEAELEPRVGGALRVRLLEAVAQGKVLAIDEPQHISFTWDWQDESLGVTTVVAIDAIDHGARTHVTLRHVGLPNARQVELHRALWEHWLGRFEAAARALPEKVETTHP